MVSFQSIPAIGGGGRGKKTKKKTGTAMALRRVCILDGYGQELFHELVLVPPSSTSSENNDHNKKQKGPSKHPRQRKYQTQWAQHVADHVLPRITGYGDDLNVGISLQHAQQTAAHLAANKIVVGHALEGDLTMLGLLDQHPPDRIRDTSTYPPFCDRRGRRQRLRRLAQQRLGRTIQPDDQFHCCAEDARAALDLYKSVWKEWEESLATRSIARTASHLPTVDTTANTSNSTSNDRGVIQALPGSNYYEARRREKKRQRNKRQRQRRRTLRREQQQQPSLVWKIQSVVHQILSKLRSLVSVNTFVLQDAVQLSDDAVLLTGRAVELRFRELLGASPRLRKKLLSRSSWRARILWLDRCLLALHSLMELLTMGLILLIATKSSDEAATTHTVITLHTISAVFLTGVSLLLAPSRFWHTAQSRVGSFLLAYYHLGSAFLLGWGQESSMLLDSLKRIHSRPFPSDKLFLLYHASSGSWFLLRSAFPYHSNTHRRQVGRAASTRVVALLLVGCLALICQQDWCWGGSGYDSPMADQNATRGVSFFTAPETDYHHDVANPQVSLGSYLDIASL